MKSNCGISGRMQVCVYSASKNMMECENNVQMVKDLQMASLVLMMMKSKIF